MAVHRRFIISAVLLFTALLALFVAFHEVISTPMYLGDIVDWARHGHIDQTFTPLGYPLFAAPAYRLAGLRGIAVLQALVFIATIYAAIRILSLLDLPVLWAAFGSLPILFHPELLLSIPKVWDVNLSTCLLFYFVLLCLRIQIRGAALPSSLALGMVFGAGLFCRPNYALLLIAFVYAVRTPAPPLADSRRRSWLISGMTFAASSVVAFALLGVVSHGSPFVPGNGPYNLYAGNNPGAMNSMWENLNAEPSLHGTLAEAMPELAAEPKPNSFYYQDSLHAIYNRLTVLFIRRHPAQALGLIGMKAFTLFRPDTKVHPLRSLGGIGKLVLALPAVLFLFLLVLPGRPLLDRKDRLLLLVYAAYILPFLVTNSDPRFRIPLDGLLLLHIVRLIYLRRHPSLPVTVSLST